MSKHNKKRKKAFNSQSGSYVNLCTIYVIICIARRIDFFGLETQTTELQ